jgi:hypothetical protein
MLLNTHPSHPELLVSKVKKTVRMLLHRLPIRAFGQSHV